MIALGCDHGGYELKQEVIKYLEAHGLDLIKIMAHIPQIPVTIRTMPGQWQRLF